MPCCVASRHRLTVIWAKTIAIQGFGTGGRLCSPNLRFWRPVLSIELHPYIYRPQRRYAPGWVRLSGGLVVERPGVAPGRRILLRAYSRMRPLPVSGRLRMSPARSAGPSRGSKKGGPPHCRPGAGGEKRIAGNEGRKGMEVIGNSNGR